MNIIVVNNKSMFDEAAANQILLQIIKKEDSAIAFATGGTPLGVYRKLVAWYRNGILDFSKIHAFNLDEFADMDMNHKDSFLSFLKANLYDSVNMNPNHIYPIAYDVESEEETSCSYENKIKSCGGLDLAILGIGLNGHIGYNEPGTPFDTLTHLSQLAPTTIQYNSKWLHKQIEEVPKQGITMGIRTIMNARKVLLLAHGEEKAEILHKAMYGTISPEVPASILQLHSNMVIVLDDKAAKYLKETA